MDDIAFTGERFLPGTKGEIWIEHWHRYHFASRWVEGRRVLDVACGEGYGSALLSQRAAQVLGVDRSAAAIEHARREYASRPGVSFAEADCKVLPLPDACIDVAVSFETIEHIDAQEAFMDELARVLKPDGVLLLSCPNKLEYTDRRGFANEFHVKELYREELEALITRRFPHCVWYGQKPSFFSVIAPEAGPAAGQLVETAEARPQETSPQLATPLYFLLAASRDAAALARVPPAISVLSDRDEWVRNDYEKVFRWMEEHAANAKRLQVEVEARRTWSWWLKLPLIRAGLLK